MYEKMMGEIGVVAEFGGLVRRLTGIEGWLAEEEGYLLYRLARDGEGEGAIVEIGSWMGRSTAWLAAGAKDGGRERVHAVDTFAGSAEHQGLEVLESEGTTYHRFAENLERVGLFDYVVPVIADSHTAAQGWRGGAIRLLFVDGDHSYEGVQRDFEVWSRYVEEGGVIVFDDVIDAWPGVQRCYREVLALADAWEQTCGIGKLRVVRRMK